MIFFFSSRRRHTRLQGDWSSDVCSSDLALPQPIANNGPGRHGQENLVRPELTLLTSLGKRLAPTVRNLQAGFPFVLSHSRLTPPLNLKRQLAKNLRHYFLGGSTSLKEFLQLPYVDFYGDIGRFFESNSLH